MRVIDRPDMRALTADGEADRLRAALADLVRAANWVCVPGKTHWTDFCELRAASARARALLPDRHLTPPPDRAKV